MVFTVTFPCSCLECMSQWGWLPPCLCGPVARLIACFSWLWWNLITINDYNNLAQFSINIYLTFEQTSQSISPVTQTESLFETHFAAHYSLPEYIRMRVAFLGVGCFGQIQQTDYGWLWDSKPLKFHFIVPFISTPVYRAAKMCLVDLYLSLVTVLWLRASATL